MPTALPPLALEEVTQSAEDPFAALNSMLSECWVSRPCKSFAVMGLRARSFRQSTRRRARTDLLVLVYDRCAGRCTGLPASRCRFALACKSGRNCAETWLCRDPARHDKLPSARLLQAPRVHRIWPHRRLSARPCAALVHEASLTSLDGSSWLECAYVMIGPCSVLAPLHDHCLRSAPNFGRALTVFVDGGWFIKKRAEDLGSVINACKLRRSRALRYADT